MHLVSWFGNIWVGRGGMIPALRRRYKIPEFPPVAFLVFLWRSFVGVAAAGWQMWIYWGKAPPSPLSVQAGAVWLYRFPIKYMAADALWVMPICLLAALAADAVINHCVTGWQCPSLTSGWLRRARFLPALTKKSSELRRAACFGNAALELQKSCDSNVLNFKRPFPHSSITKYFANYQARNQGMYILRSSVLLSPATPSKLCPVYADSKPCVLYAIRHQTAGEAVWGSKFFFFWEMSWARILAAPKGIKNTVATVGFWYFQELI